MCSCDNCGSGKDVIENVVPLGVSLCQFCFFEYKDNVKKIHDIYEKQAKVAERSYRDTFVKKVLDNKNRIFNSFIIHSTKQWFRYLAGASR